LANDKYLPQKQSGSGRWENRDCLEKENNQRREKKKGGNRVAPKRGFLKGNRSESEHEW